MQRTEVAVIGGGQAGLAISWCLTAAGVDHVILERGEAAERWRSQRRDSLRLLTPNWMTRLPGWRYRGEDPDGFMTMPEVVSFLGDYARSFGAPLATGTAVRAVRPVPGGFQVTTSRDTWLAQCVVIATGECGVSHVPPLAWSLADHIEQLVPGHYRGPGQIAGGGVLVVGASASGAQIADALARAGRPVTLAVGNHVRIPRRYRGRDIMWWLDRSGILDERMDEGPAAAATRRPPSFQLVGSPDHRQLDLATLATSGVRLAGHLRHVDGAGVGFADTLPETVAAAERRLARVLDRIDGWIAAHGGPHEAGFREPLPPVPVDGAVREIDLDRAGIRTVIWATGYRRSYPWLRAPVLDERAEIVHAGGVTSVPGLFVLGLRFLRRRKSNFIDGVGGDAEALLPEILDQLAARWRLSA